MDVITLDLDDTLITTQQDYAHAREWFGEYVAARYNVTEEGAREAQREQSRELLDEFGLSRVRFPTSMVRALNELVDSPSQKDRRRVRELGWSVFKDVTVYEENGFREGGESLIEAANRIADTTALLTAGDPVIQERKIEALTLDDRLDDINIVGMDEKAATLERYKQQGTVLHIGNSVSSDVMAAAQANADCIYVPEGEWRSDPSDGGEQYDGAGFCKTAGSLADAVPILTSI